MSFKEFLNYQLIKSEYVTINVYSILIAIGIVILTWLFLKGLHRIFMRFINKNKLDKGSYLSIYLVIKYFVWVVIVVVLMETFGVKISILLAGTAALLVGVGIGIQQIFNDFVSGIILLLERSLKIGDIIELEDGTVGKVLKINVRTSSILTRDDIVVIVPNSYFVNERIINWTHMNFTTRFHVEVGVAYGSDVELIKKVLLDSVSETQEIPKTPAPSVRFEDFGDSALIFKIFFYSTDTYKIEAVKSRLRFLIYKKFAENKITIPFPQRDVHIKNQN